MNILDIFIFFLREMIERNNKITIFVPKI